jgi:hypothetical protein
MSAKGWWLGAVAAVAVACSDDTGPSEDELAGSWLATKLELVSVASPATKVDLITLGATVRLVLSESHMYTLTLTVPDEPEEVVTGTWSASEDVLTLTEADGDLQFDMSLSGNTLHLTGADAEFDFNGDDIDEPARINVTLIRE